MSEYVNRQDQLDVYFEKASHVLPTVVNEEGELDILTVEGKKCTGFYIPTEDLECTLKRKERTRRVHVISFETWDDQSRTISHVGVITNTSNKRIYKPQVHRSPAEEIILEAE